MNIKFFWCVLLCFSVLGCPFAEPVDRALDSGCALCPSGHRCESSGGDSQAGDPIVKCIPELDSSDQDGSDAVGLFAEREEECRAFGCDCASDGDCISQYCISVESIFFCSVPCAARCVDAACPDSCPGVSECIEDDEGNTSCAP